MWSFCYCKQHKGTLGTGTEAIIIIVGQSYRRSEGVKAKSSDTGKQLHLLAGAAEVKGGAVLFHLRWQEPIG